MKNNPENDKPALLLNVIEEKATVTKEVTEKGKVRIIKKVHEEDETIHIPVTSEEVKIEKFPVDRLVEEAPTVRYEGDTMIIPVVKEVIIVEKKLLLVEEVHITKQTIHKEEQYTIPLRKEEVIVEHTAADSNKI